MRIAAVQHDIVWSDREATFAHLAPTVAAAAATGARIVLLSETFSTGFAVDDPDLNIAGFHIFTFNQLLETWHWQRAHDDAHSSTGPARPTAPAGSRPFAEAEREPA